MDAHKKMYVKMITQSLWRRVSRVLIASLSIAVGAATLCGLGLVAYMVPAQMAKELRSYGANLIVIPSGANQLTESDMTTIDAMVPETLARAPYSYTNILYNQQAIPVMATSLTDAAHVRPFWEIDGDMPGAAGEIMVGQKVADLYRFAVGDTIGFSIPDESGTPLTANLEVTGILHTGGAEDDLVAMSFETLGLFAGDDGSPTDDISIIEYSVQANQDRLEEIASNINADDGAARAEVVRRVSQSETGVTATLQTLIWIVSAIICLLTVISISATLNAIVSERAREIGLKKALGALSGDVAGEFVGESILLGLLGGIVGSLAGIWLASFISESAFAVSLDTPWWVIPIGATLSVGIALVGSLAPARRISKISPVDVLGGE